jgi:hypothetical protein
MRSPILPTRSCGAESFTCRSKTRLCLDTLLTNAARLQKRPSKILRLAPSCYHDSRQREFGCDPGSMIRSEIGRDVLVAGTNIKRDKANQRLGAAEAQLKVALDNMTGASTSRACALIPLTGRIRRVAGQPGGVAH